MLASVGAGGVQPGFRDLDAPAHQQEPRSAASQRGSTSVAEKPKVLCALWQISTALCLSTGAERSNSEVFSAVRNPGAMPVLLTGSSYSIEHMTRHRYYTLLIFLFTAAGLLGALNLVLPFLGRLNGLRCDAWYYYGLMLNPKAAALITDWLVKVGVGLDRFTSRVAAYFPFALMSYTFDTTKIEVLYFLTNLLTSSIAVFLALRRHVHIIAASTATMLSFLGTFGITYASVTYVSNAALAYGSIALLFASWAAVTSHRTRFSLQTVSGALLGMAFNAHPLSIVAFATIPVLGLIQTSGPKVILSFTPREVARAIASTLLGFVLATILLEIVSWAVLGRFGVTFLQLKAVEEVALFGTEWFYEGWWNHNGLPYFATLFLGCFLIALTSVKRKPLQSDFVLLVVGSIPLLLAAAFTMIRKDDFLLYDDFIIMFMLPLTIVVSVALSAILRNLSWPESTSAFFVHGIIVALVLAVLLFVVWRGHRAVGGAASIMLAFTSLFVLIVSTWCRSKLVYGIGLLLLIAGFQSVRATKWSAPFWLYYGPNAALEQNYSAISEAVRFIGERLEGKYPNFWISEHGPVDLVGPVYRSFVRCQYSPSFPDQLPNAELHWQHDLKPDELLVVLTGSGDEISEGTNTLKTAGLKFVPSAIKRVHGSREVLQLYVGRVTAVTPE
jgi:hypothetical protein